MPRSGRLLRAETAMLQPGDRLGRYEVVSPLGAGGMGEVYRARDTELGRDVAVKILPDGFASDPDRVKRFEREAKALAALAHPNVLTVFDVGREHERGYLVFELLQGSTLAELMRQGPLRAREALELAAQIARGLAAAHGRGIVHRDVKPANLLVTSSGTVKILDFGLARVAAAPERSTDETATGEVTGPGVALGTVSYMSPEQAQGLALDARSDIFSLGTVLYEMLSGRHPWKRASAAATLAAILHDDPPDLRLLEGRAPDAAIALVARCLEKRPEDRFQTANDLALALDLLRQRDDSRPAEASRPGMPGRLRAVVPGLAAIAVAAAAMMAWRVFDGDAALPPERLVPLTTTMGSESNPTLSPDGQQVAFEWGGEKSDNTDIYIQMIGSPQLRRLTSDPAPDWAPQWSPDGLKIAFVRVARPGAATIHVISPLGGGDRKVTDAPPGVGMSWTPDSRWLATGTRVTEMNNPSSTERGIRLIDVTSGDVRALTSGSEQVYHHIPEFSPDGRRLAYAACFTFTACHIEVVDLGSDLRPTGKARRLTRKATWPHGFLSWSADGQWLVYAAGATARVHRIGVSGGRELEVVELAGHRVANLAISAAGHRLVFVRFHNHASIARFVAEGRSESVAASSFDDNSPAFSPDGRRIAFASSRNGDRTEIWLAGADGSNPIQLTHGPGLSQGSPRFSPDGRTIAFDSQGEDGRWDIWTIDAGGGPPRRFTIHPGDDNVPSWSRDGRFLYWHSTRGGSLGIWRAPLAGGAEENVVESGGGPVFEAPDGTSLYYVSAPVYAGRPPNLSPQPIVTVPIGGGQARTVVECASPFNYFVHANGIYHGSCGQPGADGPLFLLDPTTGHRRQLGTLENWGGGLAVAPDGGSILYGKILGEGSDLMLIENFR